MKLVSLSSGSKGNATFICTDTTKVLIDCGISAKKADEGLKALGYSLSSLDAVLLTHEHSDHIKGVKRRPAGYLYTPQEERLIIFRGFPEMSILITPGGSSWKRYILKKNLMWVTFHFYPSGYITMWQSPAVTA